MSLKSGQQTERAKAYAQYLNSEHWRDLRQQAVSVHGESCHSCGNTPVQFHHLRYGNWYDVTPKDLIPLCAECHRLAHEYRPATKLTKRRISSGVRRVCLLRALKKGRRNQAWQRYDSKKWKRIRRTLIATTGLRHKHFTHLSIINKVKIMESNGDWLPEHLQKKLAKRISFAVEAKRKPPS